MGSGKSYTGRRLAELMGMPFLDLDDYVAARAGLSITEIFDRHGEKFFRELERDVLLSTVTLPLFVMATGGGTPCYHDLIDRLNELGTTVFLDVATDLLVQRLHAEAAHRPLLARAPDLGATVERKLAERRACYEKAQLRLRIDNPATDVARLIYDHLFRSSPT